MSSTHRSRNLASIFALLAVALAVLTPAAAAREWHPALDLAAPGGDPHVAMDGPGNALLVWISSIQSGGNSTVESLVRTSTGALLDPGELSDPGRNYAPRVVMNQAGDAVVIWTHIDPGNSKPVVQGVVGSSDGDFSQTFTLSSSAEWASGAELAINQAGDAVVTWSGDDIVQAAVLAADGSVSVDPVGPGFNPRPGIDAAGNATVVWQTSNAIHASVRPAGGSFSTPVDLSPSGPVYLPDVAVDPIGNAVAIWRAYSGGNYGVQTATRSAGGSFSAPVDLPGSTGGFFQAVRIDAAGTATAAWLDQFGLRTATRPLGAAFSSPSSLGLARDGLRLAVSPAGAASLAWDAYVGGRYEARASVRAPGGAFTAPTTVSPAGVTAFSASTAVDAEGDAIAAWQTSGGVQLTVYDDSPLAEPPPPPPAQPQPQPASPQPSGAPCSDCAGRATSYPLLRSAITYDVRFSRLGTTFTKLAVKPVPAGTTIRVRCTGRGCPLQSKTLTIARDARSRDLLPLLKHRRLRPGAQLEIRLTKHSTVGIVRRLRIRSNRRPLRTDRCVTPNTTTIVACPGR